MVLTVDNIRFDVDVRFNLTFDWINDTLRYMSMDRSNGKTKLRK